MDISGMTPLESEVCDSAASPVHLADDDGDKAQDHPLDQEQWVDERRMRQRYEMTVLADELEDFKRRHGLLAKHNPSSHVIIANEEDCSCYGEEAMRTYPNFFRLLPQNPHYGGLLEEEHVCGKIARSICLSLWYNLVDLASDALNTTCSTDPSRIAHMISQARCLEKYGFNVDHVIARLKQPMYKLCDLNKIMKEVTVARKRRDEALREKLEVIRLELEAEAFRLDLQSRSRYLCDLQSIIRAKKAKLGSEDEQAMRMRVLGEEIEAAEAELNNIEQEVAHFGHHNNEDSMMNYY